MLHCWVFVVRFREYETGRIGKYWKGRGGRIEQFLHVAEGLALIGDIQEEGGRGSRGIDEFELPGFYRFGEEIIVVLEFWCGVAIFLGY